MCQRDRDDAAASAGRAGQRTIAPMKTKVNVPISSANAALVSMV